MKDKNEEQLMFLRNYNMLLNEVDSICYPRFMDILRKNNIETLTSLDEEDAVIISSIMPIVIKREDYNRVKDELLSVIPNKIMIHKEFLKYFMRTKKNKKVDRIIGLVQLLGIEIHKEMAEDMIPFLGRGYIKTGCFEFIKRVLDNKTTEYEEVMNNLSITSKTELKYKYKLKDEMLRVINKYSVSVYEKESRTRINFNWLGLGYIEEEAVKFIMKKMKKIKHIKTRRKPAYGIKVMLAEGLSKDIKICAIPVKNKRYENEHDAIYII